MEIERHERMVTIQDHRRARDAAHDAATAELRTHGATPEFMEHARVFHMYASIIGYPR